MCIRDSHRAAQVKVDVVDGERVERGRRLEWQLPGAVRQEGRAKGIGVGDGCLLYTSDAADERSSVDLGGRRII